MCYFHQYKPKNLLWSRFWFSRDKSKQSDSNTVECRTKINIGYDGSDEGIEPSSSTIANLEQVDHPEQVQQQKMGIISSQSVKRR